MTQLFKGTYVNFPFPSYVMHWSYWDQNKIAVKQKVIQSDKEMINIKHKKIKQALYNKYHNGFESLKSNDIMVWCCN